MSDTLQSRWDHLDSARSAKLRRARTHSALTIPALLPEYGFSQDTSLPVPYNSLPAEGMNALATRIMTILYPTNSVPMFELGFPEQSEAERGPEYDAERQEMMEALRGIEKSATQRLRTTNLRAMLFLALLHLQCIGDALLVQNDDYSFTLYRLDQYTILRDHAGVWQEILIREEVRPSMLPERFQQVPAAGAQSVVAHRSDPQGERAEPLYTHYKRNNEGVIEYSQEFREQKFDQNTRYTVSPVFPLRWNEMTHEDYGRSLIEDMFGDIRSLDSLSKSLNDGAALNAEYRWGVNPAGLTEIRDMMDSVNGDYVPAQHNDVFPLQFQNHSQVQAAQQAVEHRERRIGRRFLMNSAVQRQGERVTAREVSIMAQELEHSLGGVLSTIAQDITVPLIRRTLMLMSRDGSISPALMPLLSTPESILSIQVRTGVEVLQRESEFERMMGLISQFSQLPEPYQGALKPREWMHKLITNAGLDSKLLVKTAEEIQAEQEAAAQQQQAMAQQETAQEAALIAAKQQGAQAQ